MTDVGSCNRTGLLTQDYALLDSFLSILSALNAPFGLSSSPLSPLPVLVGLLYGLESFLYKPDRDPNKLPVVLFLKIGCPDAAWFRARGGYGNIGFS